MSDMRSQVAALCAAVLLFACSGRDPVAVEGVGPLRAVAAHPVDFDLTADGAAARDPGGGPIAFRARWSGRTPAGLNLSSARITGTTGDTGDFQVIVIASDNRGGEVRYPVSLTIAPNLPPPVTSAIGNRVVEPGTFVDIDVLQGGASFGNDPEGDAVTWSVSLSPTAHGLRTSGTRITGTFASQGAVRARVMATDAHGAHSSFDFVIAVPGPEPGRPILPAKPYTYDPAKLALPVLMKPGQPGGGPLSDTTPAHNPVTDAGATLGRVLFHDKRLSSTRTHSCGSCHEQQRGFANGTAFPVGVTGERSRRNAMGLSNVQFNRSNRFFSDARVESLERLVLMPIEDPVELASSLPLVIARLSATDFYPQLFEAAFGTPEVTAERISWSLAQFLRSLKSFSSPFDRVWNPVQGQDSVAASSAFSPLALEGQDLFQELSCHVCHRDSFHIMGGPTGNGLDVVPADAGAGEGRFRSGSLRNIERTAPYMHDGRFATMREVIDHYDHGMKSVDPLATALTDPATGGPKRMNLTERQKTALEAFLRTLTDEEFLSDARFSDPFPQVAISP
jgi:cytochrome c peroxidase